MLNWWLPGCKNILKSRDYEQYPQEYSKVFRQIISIGLEGVFR